MDQLVAFLRACLGDDERPARAALTDGAYPKWDCPTTGVVQTAGGDLDGLVQARPSIAAHIARWDPSRVLAEVEAKRRILDWCHRMDPYPGSGGLLAGEARKIATWMAQPYCDRHGFKDEWRLT